MSRKKEEQKPTYEDLEAKVNRLEGLLERFLDTQTQKDEPKTSVFKEDIVEEQEEYVEIAPNKRIKLISLFDGILVLTTNEYTERGKAYTFNKFGEIKNINYSDVTDILHYHLNLAEAGYFYITDSGVISNHGLRDVYKNILTKEVMENIILLDKKEMIDIFTNATKEQKETVVSLIIAKIRNEEDIDLNKVDALSRVYGRNIVEMAEYIITDEE